MTNVAAIIPCLNGAKYLRPCLESVLAQDFTGTMEVLVADDGSTDDSEAIAREFASRVKWIPCPPSATHGCGAARNRAIRVTNATHLALLDADDLWLPGHVSSLVAAMEAYPAIAMACGNGYYIDGNGKRLGLIRRESFRPYMTAEAMLVKCFTEPSAVMMRRSALESVGLFTENSRLLYVEDHDMWLRILERFPGVYVESCEHCYRLHNGQVSWNPVMWQNATNIVSECLTRYPYPRSVVRKRRAVLAFRHSEVAFRQRKTLRGFALVGKAAILDPIRAGRELTARLKRGYPLFGTAAHS